MEKKKNVLAPLKNCWRKLKRPKRYSGEEINEEINAAALDLHKPFVDEIILVSEAGKQMTRIPDLVDVWFDSGAMPYAQWHYPFENKGDRFKKEFSGRFYRGRS